MSDGSVFNIGGYTSSLSLSNIILKYYYDQNTGNISTLTS